MTTPEERKALAAEHVECSPHLDTLTRHCICNRPWPCDSPVAQLLADGDELRTERDGFAADLNHAEEQNADLRAKLTAGWTLQVEARLESEYRLLNKTAELAAANEALRKWADGVPGNCACNPANDPETGAHAPGCATAKALEAGR